MFLYTKEPLTRSDLPPMSLCCLEMTAAPSLSTSALTLCLLRFAQASLPQKDSAFFPFLPTEQYIPLRHLFFLEVLQGLPFLNSTFVQYSDTIGYILFSLRVAVFFSLGNWLQ